MALTPSQLAAPLAYGALAAGAAVVLPEFLPPGLAGSPQALGGAIGVAVALAGAVIQEALTRRESASELRGRLMSLGDFTSKLREELRQLRDAQKQQSGQIAAASGAAESLEALSARVTEGGSKIDGLHAALEAAAGRIQDLETRVKELETRPLPAPVVIRDRDDGDGAAAKRTSRDRAAAMDDATVLEIISDAAERDQMELFVEPIVSLPQRRVEFYYFTPRIRVDRDTLLGPERYGLLAEDNGLAATLENMLLVRALQYVRRARRRQVQIMYFCPVTGRTLMDRDSLSDFIGFMHQNADLANLLAFAVPQRDYYRLDAKTDAELTRLAKMNFRFMLDNCTNLELFVSDLSEKGFRYVRVDQMTLDERMRGVGDPRAMKKRLDPGAIDLVVGGLHEDRTVLEALDYAVDFGMGRALGGVQPIEPIR